MSGVTGSVTVKVVPVALPLLVVTTRLPVVAKFATVMPSCVGEALVTVHGTPLIVTVLFTATALKLVPVMVTLDPRNPLVGLKELIVGAPGLLDVDPVVNTMTGFNSVESYAPLPFASQIKSIKSPALIDCVTSYAYEAASDPSRSFEYRSVEAPYRTVNNTPVPAVVSKSCTVPVIRALPVDGAVQRSTAACV